MRKKKSNYPSGLAIRQGGSISGNKVRLRHKKLSDVHNDYEWQSDPELATLDAAPVLKVSFIAYLLDYADQLHDSAGNRFPLAIDTLEGKHIGNCTCYEINQSKGETQLGIMIGDRDYWDKGYGTDAVVTMTDHVFLNTSLQRIYLWTLDWNLRAQKCFRNCGFVACGQLSRNEHSFVVMELRREHWLQQRKGSE